MIPGIHFRLSHSLDEDRFSHHRFPLRLCLLLHPIQSKVPVYAFTSNPISHPIHESVSTKCAPKTNKMLGISNAAEAAPPISNQMCLCHAERGGYAKRETSNSNAAGYPTARGKVKKHRQSSQAMQVARRSGPMEQEIKLKGKV